MVRRIWLALTLLTGCRETKAPAPVGPGTSINLAYPVVSIGQGSFTVHDNVGSLTSASLSSGVNFIERRILDSSGAIFEIKAAVQVGPSTAWWRDMGTSQQAYFLQLEKRSKSSFDDAKKLALEELNSPQGIWQGSAKARQKVEGFKTVTGMIEACRGSWDWNR